MHGLRRQIIFYGATVLRPHHKLLFGPVVARVWPIIVADVSYTVAVCLVCYGYLGPIVVGDRDNPSKDVVSVIGRRAFDSDRNNST